MFGVEIPNHLNELTVQQFDELNKIENNQELDTIEKWIEKFIYLGVPDKAFDNMELEEFAQYIKLFNTIICLPKTSPQYNNLLHKQTKEISFTIPFIKNSYTLILITKY